MGQQLQASQLLHVLLLTSRLAVGVGGAEAGPPRAGQRPSWPGPTWGDRELKPAPLDPASF